MLASERTDEARKRFDDLIALEDRTKSPVLATTLTSRAELAVAVADWRGAVAFAGRAIALFEASGGKDSGELWRPLTALGRAELALGHRDAARAALERAIEIGEHGKLREKLLAPARAALTQTP